jgi:transposase-like protein
VPRCCVHKLRNLERKAPKHALAEIRDDFHRIVYATNADAARTAYTAFERTWVKRCPGVVTSLREGGDELLTSFRFPKAQWKTLRTTNTIERLNEEFYRRVKTQGSLPSEDAMTLLPGRSSHCITPEVGVLSGPKTPSGQVKIELPITGAQTQRGSWGPTQRGPSGPAR